MYLPNLKGWRSLKDGKVDNGKLSIRIFKLFARCEVHVVKNCDQHFSSQAAERA